MFFEQIEKFQCLSLSTAQSPSRGILKIHVGTCHVSQNVSESQSTLEYNIFKNQTCLISRTIPPTHQMPYGAGNTVRTPVQIILYISLLWPPVIRVPNEKKMHPDFFNGFHHQWVCND